MRPSNKVQILEAAIAIVEREGVTGLTYESVAEEMNMTKGGIMYHFPTRESLVLGMYEFMATTWEAQLVRLAGKPAEDATAKERLTAYVNAATTAATRTELLLALEGVHNPQYNEPISRVMDRWTFPFDADSITERDVELLTARLASDGLWLLEAWSNQSLPTTVKQRVIDHINRTISDSD